MWTRRPNGLACSREDYRRVLYDKYINRVLISRPGYEDVIASNILTTHYGSISFDGVTEWFRDRGWTNRKHYLPFVVSYERGTGIVRFSYIGD